MSKKGSKQSLQHCIIMYLNLQYSMRIMKNVVIRLYLDSQARVNLQDLLICESRDQHDTFVTACI